MIHYEGGEVVHDGFNLKMQLSYHIITATASNKFDYFRMNNVAEQGRRSGLTEVTGKHVLGLKDKVEAAEGDSSFQCPSGHVGVGIFPLSKGISYAYEYICGVDALLLEVKYSYEGAYCGEEE